VLRRLVGEGVEQLEFLQPDVDEEVVAQMRGIDLVDGAAGPAEVIVVEIGRIGERRVAPARGPVGRYLEMTVGLDRAAPVAIAIAAREGIGVELVEPGSLDVEGTVVEALLPRRS